MSAPGQHGVRKPRLTGNRCECTTCGELFNGVSGFNRHRVGRYGVDRRCLDASEMAAFGFSRNATGFWVTESDNQRAARHAGTNCFAARSKVPVPSHQFDPHEEI